MISTPKRWLRRPTGPRAIASALSTLGMMTRTLAITTIVGCVAMMAMSMIPLAFGWRSTVVLSGSMMPRIVPGDVVASAPMRGHAPQQGQVILVHDPSTPGHLLMHRFLGVDKSGRLITRGDANQQDDSLPITAADIAGLPRIRVPWIGLPSLWVQEHDVLRLLLIVAFGTSVCVVAFGRRTPQPRLYGA